MAEVHNLGHPSIHSTRWLVAEHFVWRGLHADIAKWARECIAYQRNKVQQACSRSHPAISAGLSTCACWHCRPFATVRYLLTRWSVYTVAGSCASRDNHCRRLYHCFPFCLGISFWCAWLHHLWSGVQFVSALWQQLSNMCDTTLRPTTDRNSLLHLVT